MSRVTKSIKKGRKVRSPLETAMIAKVKYNVTDEYLRPLMAGMNNELKRMGLNWSETPSTTYGSRPADDKTIKNYEKHYRGLKYFCALTGAYDSALILQDLSPFPLCPSI
jgi:hypothetical protein